MGEACKKADGGSKCAGPAIACDDKNPCTKDGCDAKVGCNFEPYPYDPVSFVSCNADDDECTGNDYCSNGVCKAGISLDCDDKNACTADGCEPPQGCSHAGVTDGSKCPDGSCQGGVCVPLK